MIIRRVLLAILLLIAVTIAYMYSVAVRDPVIRLAEIALADWPKGVPPMTVMLISDVHVAGPDMPPERLTRIV